jgi:c-di-GMP-binding flagellar brake protein YcgR
VRLRGEATLEQRDLIRFRPEQPAEVLQRREFVRIDSPQPVVVDGAVRTHAVDLSGGGMLLRGLEHLVEGQRVRFSLELGGSEPPIRGGARVVRAGDGGQRGLVFDAITPKERQRLIHFIFEKQRIAIARTRGTRKRRKSA